MQIYRYVNGDQTSRWQRGETDSHYGHCRPPAGALPAFQCLRWAFPSASAEERRRIEPRMRMLRKAVCWRAGTVLARGPRKTGCGASRDVAQLPEVGLERFLSAVLLSDCWMPVGLSSRRVYLSTYLGRYRRRQSPCVLVGRTLKSGSHLPTRGDTSPKSKNSRFFDDHNLPTHLQKTRHQERINRPCSHPHSSGVVTASLARISSPALTSHHERLSASWDLGASNERR